MVGLRRPGIALDRRRIEQFCEENHIRWLTLFGSALRDDFRPTSVVDVLVEFEPGVRVGFIRLAELEQTLSAIVGRKVDLRTPSDLSRCFREAVVSTAEVLYERR